MSWDCRARVLPPRSLRFATAFLSFFLSLGNFAAPGWAVESCDTRRMLPVAILSESNWAHELRDKGLSAILPGASFLRRFGLTEEIVRDVFFHMLRSSSGGSLTLIYEDENLPNERVILELCYDKKPCLSRELEYPKKDSGCLYKYSAIFAVYGSAVQLIRPENAALPQTIYVDISGPWSTDWFDDFMKR